MPARRRLNTKDEGPLCRFVAHLIMEVNSKVSRLTQGCRWLQVATVKCSCACVATGVCADAVELDAGELFQLIPRSVDGMEKVNTSR